MSEPEIRFSQFTGLSFSVDECDVKDIKPFVCDFLVRAAIADARRRFQTADYSKVVEAGGEVREVAVHLPDGSERIFTFEEFEAWLTE